ncbi:hypothetical protein GCM10010103_42280 [Streptomyces paradoxus]
MAYVLNAPARPIPYAALEWSLGTDSALVARIDPLVVRPGQEVRLREWYGYRRQQWRWARLSRTKRDGDATKLL